MIYIDHRPLTLALRSKPDKYSHRETRLLDFVSEVTSDIQHIFGGQNVAAVALSRLPVNSLSSPSDIDFQQMALDQPRLDTLDLLSPEFATGKFTYLPVPTSDSQMIWDTSTDSSRSLNPNDSSSGCFWYPTRFSTPESWSQGIWFRLDSFGRIWGVTLLPGHVLVYPVKNQRCKPASTHLTGYLALQTLGSAMFIVISLARSLSPIRHFGRICSARPHIGQDIALRNSHDCYHRSWWTVRILPLPGNFKDFRDKSCLYD